jgi:hypothetical protein
MIWIARLVVGGIAAAALVCAIAAHVSATEGANVEARYPNVWWLHYASMALFAASLPVLFLLTGRRRAPFGEVLSLIPWWALVAIVAMLVYTLYCFVTLTPQTGAGVPMISNGRYYFNDHGTVREVSSVVFHAERAASVRVFSALWIYLTLIATVVLLFARRREDQ